jgi:2-amino-4-hydroxy-6-hydroxymethyldihydropteridine diphosphokinase
MRAGVALGSNLGDRLANLRAARKAIVDLVRHRTDSPWRARVAPPILASPIYETEPIGCEPGAQKFLNAVLEFEYKGEPAALLERLLQIEQLLGRERNHPSNVSRNIDIDLLYFGGIEIDNKKLQVPHPRLHLRKFVLQPLADIRPDLILPNQAKSVRELLAQVDNSGKVSRFKDQW